MSDDYTPTTENVRDAYTYFGRDVEHWESPGARRRAELEFDRWLAAVRADAVMGFATHYLKHDDWRKARQHAQNIREGNA